VRKLPASKAQTWPICVETIGETLIGRPLEGHLLSVAAPYGCELLEHAQHFGEPRGMFRLLRHHSLLDQFHRQHPARFFPIRRINVPDDGCYTLVLIGCALRY
jgi:hypothetical protein